MRCAPRGAQIGVNVKRIRKGLYFITAILTLFLPMQAAAAGQDGVSLVQEEDSVSIVLEMGNAEQEKISAVAVSLQIGQESRDKVNVEFEFAGELAGAAEGFLYNESTGVLDIYAASDRSLFHGESLNLGHVRVTLKDSGQILPVEISYRDGSFQAANEAYGEKRPMVANTPDPVNMQIGEGAGDTGGDAGGDLSGGGNTDKDPGQDSTIGAGTEPGQSGSASDGGVSGGNSSEGGNVDDGLQDDHTEFVNDPSGAQNISSAVVRKNEIPTELVDMSQGAAASIGGGSRPGAGTPKWTRPEGKVSVVSPEKGPASIFVADSGQSSSGETSPDREEETGEEPFREENAFGDGESIRGEEIVLDQKNGGAKDSQNEKRNRILVGAGITIVCAGGVGLAAFALVKTKGALALKKRKKPVRKKRKKPVPKKRRRP